MPLRWPAKASFSGAADAHFPELIAVSRKDFPPKHSVTGLALTYLLRPNLGLNVDLSVATRSFPTGNRSIIQRKVPMPARTRIAYIKLIEIKFSFKGEKVPLFWRKPRWNNLVNTTF